MNYKSLSLIVAVILVMVGMSGCKYPEGPFLSIQTREGRVAKKWEVIMATDSAGEDISNNFDEAEFDFEEDGEAEATLEVLGIPVEFEGDWNLDNDDTVLELELEQKTTNVPLNKNYEILRLTRTEFWLRDQDNDTELRLEVK